MGKDFFPNDFFFSGELFPSREKAPGEGFQSTSGRILRKSRNEEKKKEKKRTEREKGSVVREEEIVKREVGGKGRKKSKTEENVSKI